MAELPPNSAPEDSQQSSAPNGWELACVGILRSEFGRVRSRALDKAVMQLSAEKAWLENRAESARSHWWKQILGAFSRPGFAFAMSVAALLFAAASWIFFATMHEENLDKGAVVCRIADAVGAQWGGTARQFKVEDALPKKSLRLESGLVELAFASGARAAIQGPVDFTITGRNSMDLRRGKISADVPREARGFTVRTPAAAAVDLGTRFGVDARSDGSSDVEVFEGRVHVVHGHDGGVQNDGWDLARGMAMVLDARSATAGTFSEASFPQISHTITTRPTNCGFDSPTATRIGGFPSSFGVWSGPAFTLTGSFKGVRPASGSGMLRFLAPPRGGGSGGDSVVWQLIDLSAARKFVAEFGTAEFEAWGRFNRVRADSHSATRFRISIAAFHGRPAQAPDLWAARDRTALAFAEKEFEADNNPRTWQTLDVTANISAEADFAVIELRAIAPEGGSATADPFPGNFADTIEAKVSLPLRPGNVTSTP